MRCVRTGGWSVRPYSRSMRIDRGHVDTVAVVEHSRGTSCSNGAVPCHRYEGMRSLEARRIREGGVGGRRSLPVPTISRYIFASLATRQTSPRVCV